MVSTIVPIKKQYQMKPLFTLMITVIMTTLMHAQDWVDPILYPFESKYIQLDGGNMHYIDEGKGDIILFVHGTPTWSFLYRDFVKELSKDYRCIAIDHLGFGLSDKPESFSGTPQAHSENLSKFIEKLNLNDITLVVHDFGGPIGIGTALGHPDRIKKIVLMNSWLWETKNDEMAQQIDGLLKSEDGKAAYLDMNYSPKVLLPQAFVDKSKLTEKIHTHYTSPFPDRQSRMSLLNIGLSFVGASDWYEAQWKRLGRLQHKEWLILWGTKDPFLNTSYLEKWKERIPEATVRTFESGHFVQEEATEEAIAALKNFLINS